MLNKWRVSFRIPRGFSTVKKVVPYVTHTKQQGASVRPACHVLPFEFSISNDLFTRRFFRQVFNRRNRGGVTFESTINGFCELLPIGASIPTVDDKPAGL